MVVRLRRVRQHKEPIDQNDLGRVEEGQKLLTIHVRREFHKRYMLDDDDVIRVRVPIGSRHLEPDPTATHPSLVEPVACEAPLSL